ncbi:hypothetical protein SADUNF_Sadunf19G0042500 [Salix dunnii]|uniref:Uncharacterized protein n=1 Tax=Salix dunnii TaxID=1413687 RepID=A0A835MKX6_9ROSI|nr:hypothetical protein SADUNF_Sadunf19G0042500 [Salix dunnii]
MTRATICAGDEKHSDKWQQYVQELKSNKVIKQDHCIKSGVKITSLVMRNPSSTTSTRSKITVPTPCCSKVGIKKGPWTPEEDELLASYIKKEESDFMVSGLLILFSPLSWAGTSIISQGIDPRTHKPLKPNPDSSEMANVPVQNCNPKPPRVAENGRVYRTVATRVSKNFTVPPNLDDQFPNKVAADATEYCPARDGFNMGSLQSGYDQGKNDDDLIENIGNEDTLSSFLDSLLNDNVFVYQQRQQLQQQNMSGLSSKLVVSSSQILSHGNIWEAQVSSPPMAAFGDKSVAGAPSNSLPVLTQPVLRENQTDVINGMY